MMVKQRFYSLLGCLNVSRFLAAERLAQTTGEKFREDVTSTLGLHELPWLAHYAVVDPEV